VGWLWIVLLACAVAVLVAAEWPRLTTAFGWEGRRARSRARRKAEWKLLKPEEVEDDSDEFAASVERDLAQLPTTNDRDRT
jgi:cell division protein FtsL